MNHFGLFPKYRVNRQLSHAERINQLRQSERINVEPHYQLCVIAMNSTYLESVDKWYGWRGSMSVFIFPMLIITTLTLAAMVHASISRLDGWRLSTYDLQIMAITTSLLLPMILFLAWLLRKDWFCYTHYPMRFNRKNKLVYVFRTDGTVYSAPWGDIHFTLGEMEGLQEYEVRGHILDSCTKNVQETFPLSYASSMPVPDERTYPGDYLKHDLVRSHWEFIRRYMEDGPQSVSSQVQFCMPIDGRRESAKVGIERTFANIASAPYILYLVLWPYCAVVSVLRLIAMRSSKIPTWPEEVEASCEIDPDDPYAIVGNEIGDRVAVFPEAASAAGVQFRPPANHNAARRST